MNGLKSNWVWRFALAIVSVALAGIGVLGWADMAGALEASRASVGAFFADLEPLWPICLFAAIGCVAAQVVAGCATVNFARLAQAHWIWRFGCFAFYGVCVVFAAMSAEMGAQSLINQPHKAAYQARETERGDLTRERAQLNAFIAAEAAKMPDAATTYTSRQEQALARFNAVTQSAHDRLKEIAAALDARPPMAERRAPSLFEMGTLFVLFLMLALLEPWGYALAERGNVPKDGAAKPRSRKPAPPEPSLGDKVVAFGRGAAKAAGTAAAGVLAALPFFASPAPAEAATPAVDPISHEAPAGETDDGSSEFGPPVEPVTKSERRRRAPPSLPIEVAVREADRFAAANGGVFSSHKLAALKRAQGHTRWSQSNIARSLAAAREVGQLNDRPWARKWLRTRGVR